MNNGIPSSPGGKDAKVTWVVICKDAAGKPVSEYVEGTELVTDPMAGALRIMDSGRLVREYTAGAWSNFCEWVTAYTDFFSSNVIRLSSEQAPTVNLADSQRALSAAMAMGTDNAISLLKGSLPKPRRTSEADGAVRTPARLPGRRHA